MALLAKQGQKESQEFKQLDAKYKYQTVIDFGDEIARASEIAKKLRKIAAFALLYSCQGPHQYAERLALLYEPAADTTAHAWYPSDTTKNVVQPIYYIGGKRFNHVIDFDSLSPFMAQHPKAALVWSGVYDDVRDSIRNARNIEFIEQ
jgi:hypothetical protein